MSELWIASLVALWVIVLVMAFLLAGALRHLGIIQMRLGDDPGALITETGLDRGTNAPDFEAAEIETGESFKLSDLPQRARLLVFISTDCTSCKTLVPHINEVFSTRRDEFDFLVVCRGDAESCRTFARINGLRPMTLADPSGSIGELYQVNVLPFAYVLDYQRRVLIRGVANDWTQIESLLEQEGTAQGSKAWSAVGDD